MSDEVQKTVLLIDDVRVRHSLFKKEVTDYILAPSGFASLHTYGAGTMGVGQALQHTAEGISIMDLTSLIAHIKSVDKQIELIVSDLYHADENDHLTSVSGGLQTLHDIRTVLKETMPPVIIYSRFIQNYKSQIQDARRFLNIVKEVKFSDRDTDIDHWETMRRAVCESLKLKLYTINVQPLTDDVVFRPKDNAKFYSRIHITVFDTINNRSLNNKAYNDWSVTSLVLQIFMLNPYKEISISGLWKEFVDVLNLISPVSPKVAEKSSDIKQRHSIVHAQTDEVRNAVHQLTKSLTCFRAVKHGVYVLDADVIWPSN